MEIKNIEFKWKNKKSICIVLTSKGYPDKFEKNILIENLENLKNQKSIYFSCWNKKLNNKFYSNGGRVLNFVSLDDNFGLQEKSLNLIKKLNWKMVIIEKILDIKL